MTDHHAATHRGASVPAGRATAAAWDLRLLRAVPFALVCTLVATAGHGLVGGGDVAPYALLLGFAAVLGIAVLLGGRERSLVGIAGALGAGQLGLHLLFHGLSSGAGAAMAGMQHPGMAEAAGRLLCDDRVGDGLTVVPLDTTPEQVVTAAGLDPQAFAAAAAPHAAGLFGLTPGMLLGHLAAAVVAGWWLRRGEAALWRLVRVAATAAQEWAAPLRTALALAAALLLGPLAGDREPGHGRARAGSWRLPVAAALRHSVVRRGPPAAAFAR
ncbi:hypothetical protein [Kitasatospora cinereorecta]|uniref:hypothetical protein n=1 Tax=Kitasatospora cinereorecta TaxID=285560 RepID=UPI0031F88F61